MRLNWSKLLFFGVRRRRKTKIIGHDIFASCRSSGKFVLINGICISLKSKKQKLLTSAISIKNVHDTIFFINFPIYLSGALNFKITGLTYGFKINCSKLVESRYK